MPRKRPLAVDTTKHHQSGDGGGTGDKEPSSAAASAEMEVGEPMSPAGRLFHEPNFNSYIVAVMGIGRRIDVEVVKEGLEATLVRHPRFSSLQVFDKSGKKKPRWVRTKVVVEDHLVVPDLRHDAAAAAASTADQLVDDYISSLSTTTLPFSRPLWDLHILNVPTSTAEATAVLRVHHSHGDGVSLMSLLLSCTRKTSEPDSLPSLPETRCSAPTAQKSNLFVLLLRLWSLLVLMWNTLVDVLLFTATAAFLRDTDTPIKGAEGVEFRRKRFVHRTVSLDDVKKIKNTMGCTINDVLVGITSAALSRYLQRRYANGSDGSKNGGLPANIRLRTTLLVNIRPTPGIHDLAEMMKGDRSTARWGNCLGYMILPFPIVECEDPLDYVRKGKAITERKKKSLEAIFTYKSAYMVVKIFGMKAAAALCYRVLTHTTLSFSNVVGPIEEVSFYGHPLVYLAPSVYGHPNALTVHFQSYMNKLTMVLAVDELVIPDPEQLLEDLADSLKLMRNSIAARS